MPMLHARLLLPAALVIALGACAGDVAPPAPAPGAPVGLATLRVEAGRPSAHAWDGVIEAERQAVLSAQTAGRVAEVAHDVGDHVPAGALLVRLSAVEQQAGADAARARVRLAEATYRRMAELARDRYVSGMQLDQARAELDVARAQLAELEQQRAYTVVHAPYTGFVNARHVHPGESVGIGQPLMAMFEPGAMRIEVSVPQSDAEAIRRDPVASVRLDDGRTVESADVTVFPAADAASHSVRIRVRLPPLDPPPWPGTTAKVSFRSTAGEAFPRIPASALVRRGEVNAVYVLKDDRLSLRHVRPGGQEGDAVEVISGLEPGEIIAVDATAARRALVAARGKD